MSQSKVVRKLRSSPNCVCIQKRCLEQLNGQVFDQRVKTFLAIRDQINCQKINSQTFIKPKPDPQILSDMRQLGVKQREQANHLISLAKKAETKILVITEQEVKSQQKVKPKQEMFLDDEFHEEQEILEESYDMEE